MKKLLLMAALLLPLSASAKKANGINPKGKWVTTEPMTKINADSVDVTYTFTNDSLYIDVYPSGCPLAQMSISNFESTKIGFKFDAIDTLYDIFDGDIISEKHYHLEFIKVKKRCFEVRRDGKKVDVIKRFP